MPTLAELARAVDETAERRLLFFAGRVVDLVPGSLEQSIERENRLRVTFELRSRGGLGDVP